MRIMFGSFQSGKKVYAYMTMVDLFNHQICDYEGNPIIYSEIELKPNVFDKLYKMIAEQGRAKGYNMNNICFVNSETGKEVKNYD